MGVASLSYTEDIVSQQMPWSAGSKDMSIHSSAMFPEP